VSLYGVQWVYTPQSSVFTLQEGYVGPGLPRWATRPLGRAFWPLLSLQPKDKPVTSGGLQLRTQGWYLRLQGGHHYICEPTCLQRASTGLYNCSLLHCYKMSTKWHSGILQSFLIKICTTGSFWSFRVASNAGQKTLFFSKKIKHKNKLGGRRREGT
jgi:hypothetical protein